MTADIDRALELCCRALREALGPSRGPCARAVERAAVRAALTDLVRLAEVLDVPATSLLGEPGQGNVVAFRSEPSAAEGHAIATAFFRIHDARARSTLLALAGHLAD